MHIKCGNQRAKFNSSSQNITILKNIHHRLSVTPLRLLIYRDIFLVFYLNFVNMLMKKMQWINNDKGKLIIISIWFPINSIDQSIGIVSWNVNILKDESVRKGEVLVTVVEEKLSSVGPVDQTIINIITRTLITTTQHHTSTTSREHFQTSSWWGSLDECRNQFVHSAGVWARRWRYQIILVNQEGNFRSLSSLSTFTNKQQATVRCIFYLYTLYLYLYNNLPYFITSLKLESAKATLLVFASLYLAFMVLIGPSRSLLILTGLSWSILGLNGPY